MNPRPPAPQGSEDWALRAPDAPELADALRLIGRIARAHGRGEAAPAMPAFVWGHLQVYERLGAGSYGEVFRAYDPVLQRDVALKLLRDSPGEGLAARDFILEARRLARVRHPNVLAVHGADFHDGRAGLWAELVPGATLESRLADGPLPPPEVLRIGLQLAAALREVHAAGLVHADVKAGNTLIEPGGRAVLMDFGAGREARAAQDHAVVGSPLCMAPEQFEGGAATPASDQYALGVLLYRGLAGRYPVEGADFEALRAAHAAGRAVDLGALPRGTERALRELVAQLLARDPAARPDPAQTIAALRRIAALPATRSRDRLRLAAVAAGVVALAGTSLGLWQALEQARDARAARAEAEAVNRFLTDTLAAPRLDESGDRVLMVEVLDMAAQRLADDHLMSDSQRAAVADVIGHTYLGLGRHAEALRWQDHALAARVSAGDDPTDARIALLAALATACERQRAHAELAHVDPLPAGSGAEREVALLEARADLADCDGDGRAAVALRDRALALASSAPLDPRERLRLAGSYGAGLLRAGEVARGLAVLDTALSAANTTLPPADSVVLSLRYYTAIAYGYSGRNADAARLTAETLELARARTAEPAYLARIESALGAQLYDLGQYDESLEHTDAAIALLEPRVGPQSESVLVLVGNRANALRALGRTEEAELEFRRAIAGLSAIPGSGRNTILLITYNLVETLNESNRAAEAEALAVPTLEEARRSLGESHLVALELQDAIGIARLAQGDAAAAEAIHRGMVEAKRAALGDDSQYTLFARHRLARALHGLGRADEARAEAVAAADGLTRVLGDEHPATRAARADLAAWSR